MPAGRWVFYYDGDCGFCRGTVRVLAAVDFFRKLTWRPFQDLDTPPRGVSWADLDRAAYLETGTPAGGQAGAGKLYEGFYAFRMLSLRLAPLMPLAPLLWLPGVNRPGAAAYRWVARNRHRISNCGWGGGGG